MYWFYFKTNFIFCFNILVHYNASLIIIILSTVINNILCGRVENEYHSFKTMRFFQTITLLCSVFTHVKFGAYDVDNNFTSAVFY